MKRRTFLATIATAIAAPRIVLRPADPREALLAAFARKSEHTRYTIMEPWLHTDRLVYATDAYAMARADLSCPVADGVLRPPPVDECWAKYWRPTQWRDWEPAPIERLTPDFSGGICPACGNRRVSYGDQYPDAEWMQWLGDVLDYDVDDNTHRDQSCELCHGRTYYGPSIETIGGVRISAWAMRRVAAIPGVRVAVSEEPYTICFRGGGIEGVHMGVNG